MKADRDFSFNSLFDLGYQASGSSRYDYSGKEYLKGSIIPKTLGDHKIQNLWTSPYPTPDVWDETSDPLTMLRLVPLSLPSGQRIFSSTILLSSLSDLLSLSHLPPLSFVR